MSDAKGRCQLALSSSRPVATAGTRRGTGSTIRRANLYLKNHGKSEDARRYLRIAVELPGVDEWGKALAADRLRSLGDDDKKAGKGADAAAKDPD
jgi:hypothetical protein